MTKSKSNPMWGGRFSASASESLQEINQSISFDIRLAKQDIAASIAHCKMLAKSKIITQKDAKKIVAGLNKIGKRIADDKFVCKTELEDIHMNIEAALTKLIGNTAGKLHTARSRNDQVITDFKLWIREAYEILDENLQELQLALVKKAQKNTDTIMPGFTHMQPAQPITFGHHMMAYFEMFKRDRQRIKNACGILNECPLGCAALAGTSFPIDRKMTAKELGFNKPTANSLDTISDRDFVADYLYVVSLCAIHLSRLAEEIVLWSSYQFGFIKLPDFLTTGSSIMPQKRNPDAAELVRAKAGPLIGSLTSFLAVLKGLPLGYSKDLQEDKEPVFAANDTILLSTTIMSEMIQHMLVDKKKMLEATKTGFLTATDLADWLVKNLGVTFRKAHQISGKIVKLAEKNECELADLDLAAMQKIEPKITKDIYKVLAVESCVKNKTSFGGTAPKRVGLAVKTAKHLLK